MLVDPDLWTAFNDVKERLLTAIATTLPFEPHILSLDPSDRDSFRRSKEEIIGELDMFTTQLQKAINDLDGSCKDIHTCRSRVQTSLSPIAHLPPELIRHVVKLAVGAPGNTRTILNLSHVSMTWREVVTSTAELFTELNWNNWHDELVTIWLNRAREQPQKITLDQALIGVLKRARTVDTKGTPQRFKDMGPLRGKLEQALLNCYHLNVNSDYITQWWDSDEWFRGWIMPRLEELHMNSAGDRGIVSIPENSPALRSVSIYGRFPLFDRSSLITKMVCGPGNEPPWSAWAVMLNNMPSLESLSLEFDYCSFDGAPPLRLPLLHTLEVASCKWLNETEICEMIGSFVVPKIETLIFDLQLKDEFGDTEAVWDRVVSLLS